MNDFSVITPKERDRLLAKPTENRALSPRSKALLAGDILFIPGDSVDSLRRTLISLAKHHGKSARTRKTVREGVPGLMVWWEERAVMSRGR